MRGRPKCVTTRVRARSPRAPSRVGGLAKEEGAGSRRPAGAGEPRRHQVARCRPRSCAYRRRRLPRRGPPPPPCSRRHCLGKPSPKAELETETSHAARRRSTSGRWTGRCRVGGAGQGFGAPATIARTWMAGRRCMASMRHAWSFIGSSRAMWATTGAPGRPGPAPGARTVRLPRIRSEELGVDPREDDASPVGAIAQGDVTGEPGLRVADHDVRPAGIRRRTPVSPRAAAAGTG